MASVQQAHNVAQFNDKEKSKMGEVMKEAKAFLGNNKNNAKAGQQEFAMVAGSMKNNQERPIKLNKIHNYSGFFVANPPETIPGNGSGAFVNQGVGAGLGENGPAIVVGPKAALIYGHCDNLPHQLGWLLAYDKPDDSNAPNKVYVEAGSLSRLMSMDRKEIENKLDASDNISRYWDSDTGALAVAEIQDQGNKLAFLGASFEIRA